MISINPLKILNLANYIKKHNSKPKENVSNFIGSEKEKNNELLTPQGQYIRDEIFLSNPIQQKNGEEMFDDFVFGKGKVTFDNYMDLKSKVPDIRLVANDFLNKYNPGIYSYVQPEISAKIAVKCKEYLDSEYGKDNYRIISIGTSPSFVTEPISALGSEVIFLPVSSIKNCYTDDSLKTNFKYFPNLKVVASYLKSKLTNKPQDDNKTTLLLDYSITGKTLNLVERIANEYCNIDKSKCKKISLQNIFSKLCEKSIISSSQKDGILYDVLVQKVDMLSNTPHFNIISNAAYKNSDNQVFKYHKPNREVFREFDNYSNPFARTYHFCVLDEINKIFAE